MPDPDAVKQKDSDFTRFWAKSFQFTSVISNLIFLKTQSGSTSPGSAKTNALKYLPDAATVPLGKTKILKRNLPTVMEEGEQMLRVGRNDNGSSNINSISPVLRGGQDAGSVLRCEELFFVNFNCVPVLDVNCVPVLVRFRVGGNVLLLVFFVLTVLLSTE